MTLPAIIPADAKLPERYEKARQQLAECYRVDEWQDWADKMAALASYGRLSKDEELVKMAMRIRGRAIERVGELLKSIEPAKGGRPSDKPGCAPTPVSRIEAARDSGLSTHQAKTALRVASVPKQQFEAFIESEAPPSVTALAEIGKKAPAFDILKGRDPKDFKQATALLWIVSKFATDLAAIDVAAGIRGCSAKELAALRGGVFKLKQDALELSRRLA